MKSIVNQPDLVNSGGSVYQQQKDFGLKSRVFNNNTGFIVDVVNQANGDPVIKIPFESRWYNSYLLGVTKDCRFLKTYCNDLKDGRFTGHFLFYTSDRNKCFCAK